MGRFREDPGFMTHLHHHPNTDEQVMSWMARSPSILRKSGTNSAPALSASCRKASRTPRAIVATSLSTSSVRALPLDSKSCSLLSTHS